MTDNNDKTMRVLDIYTRLMNGEVVNKALMAHEYGVNERSIQRDIADIQAYFEQRQHSDSFVNAVTYDRTRKGYCLEQIYKMKLSNSEILAICKILLDSRAFTKPEMEGMLGRLIKCCVPKDNQKLVTDLIRNEEFHYIEPQHKSVFIDKMWEIGQAIQQQRYIEIEYWRMKDKKVIKRKVKPMSIMFSEYYFYMAAFIDGKETHETFEVKDDAFPTIYRIDRIQSISVLDEKFRIPYSNRFEEGEFRKRIQFMYGGKLQRVKFKYRGESVEAVLDRLPTAKVLSEEGGVYTISAEVFGKGIDMWLRSQGEAVEVM